MRNHPRKDSRISLFSEPVEFFRQLIAQAIENQRVTIREEAEFYLVVLLNHFMQVDLMKRSEKDPLAIKLHKSLQAGTVERSRILKDMGDFSLYISGFFSDSLKRKIIDVDYYMAMGEAAYHTLAIHFREAPLQMLYKDLGERFGTYVDILGEVSDKAFSHTNQDILRLYEKWLKTRSQRLASLLKEKGIMPNPNLFRESH